MLRQIIYLGLCSIVVAGIVHIAVILLIPVLGERDAARQIIAKTPELEFQRLDTATKQLISNADPFFSMSVCRFSVGENGVIVSADRMPDFWSASIYNERGAVIYSLNDRTAIANRLRLLIVNPIQMAAIRQLQPDELETSIVVETQTQQGFILVRSFTRDPSLEDRGVEFLQSAKCGKYETLG